MAGLQIEVETYSGHRGDERPTSFRLNERTFTVNDIVDRWYGPDHDYFKLIADDGILYIIRHDRGDDSWEITLMEADSGAT